MEEDNEGRLRRAFTGIGKNLARDSSALQTNNKENILEHPKPFRTTDFTFNSDYHELITQGQTSLLRLARLSQTQRQRALLLTYLNALDKEHGVMEFGRSTSFYGQEGLNYRYSGRDHIALPMGSVISYYHQLILRLAKHYNLGHESYNHILLNRYEQGQELNPHKDNEPELEGGIFSLSFGTEGLFSYGLNKPILGGTTLRHGDILFGNQAFFKNYFHGAKSLKAGTRFNLTFRTLNT